MISQWNDFAQQQSAWLASDAVSSAAQWSTQLAAATTPAAIDALTSSWQAFLAQQRTAVVAAQQAKLADALKSAGGPQAVLASARRLVAVAASANLDAGNVAPLATQLSNQIAAGDNTDAIATGEQLLPAMAGLQSLVNLNNQVVGQVLPLLWSVDQAQAEGTPKAAALAAQQSAIAAQFRAARTADQLNAVAAAVTSLQSQIAAELAANQCGHAGGSRQGDHHLAVAPGDGLLPGRLRGQGDPGHHRAPAAAHADRALLDLLQDRRRSPSSRRGRRARPSTTTRARCSWVMEFAGGGYFIHDAPWESSSSYGPGGEDNLQAASHGCVHTPRSVMQWAFSWTPIGTPVVISA